MKKIINAIRRLSIMHKLLLVFIAIIIFWSTILNLISTQTMYQIMTEQIVNGNKSTMESAGMRIVDIVRRGSDVLVGISINKNLQKVLEEQSDDLLQKYEDMETINDLLKDYSFNLLSFECTVALVTEDGSVYLNREIQNIDSLKAIKEEYDVFAQGEHTKGSPLYREMKGDIQQPPGKADEYNLIYMLPVYNKNRSSRLGILILTMSQEYLQSSINFADINNHDSILIDETGTIISAGDLTLIGQPAQQLEALSGSEPGQDYYHTDHGFVTIHEIPQLNWRLVDIMDSDYAMRQIRKVPRNMAVTNLLSVIMMFAAISLVAKSLTNPLKRLAEDMMKQDYEAFEMEHRELGKNEISMLQHSFLIMQKKVKSLLQENIKKEREKRKTELEALQAQIQPHFLFNTLNTIRCSIINDNTDKAADMVYSLSMLLRLTIVRKNELVMLRDEIEEIGYYIDLIKMRHSTKFEVVYLIDEKAEEYLVPKLILQPLVENSISHGFETMRTGGIIKVIVEYEGDGLYIKIADNGPELKADSGKPEKGRVFSGIGTKNVDKRIKLFYGDAFGYSLYKDSDGWTIAQIYLPKEGVAYDKSYRS